MWVCACFFPAISPLEFSALLWVLREARGPVSRQVRIDLRDNSPGDAIDAK